MTTVGLVLGAGGVTGEAFHRGVLSALADAGWDARKATALVGTSAGSIVAAGLRAPADGRRDRFEAPIAAGVRRIDAVGAFAAAARRPWRARPLVLAASLLPAGRQSADLIAAGVRSRFGATWPAEPLWIVAVRRRDGARVVFGRDGAPTTDVGTAVAASCAIPGYFRPVVIDGEAYVDGGVHSATNADLLAGGGLDLVVVSSPLSVSPASVRPRIDLSLRLLWHRYVVAETRAVRRSGTAVLVVEPGAAALARMGVNTMRARNLEDIEELAARTTAHVLRRPANATALYLLQAGATNEPA